METDSYWKQALAQSEAALAASALVPLATRLESMNGEDGVIFEIRHLTGVPPRHLRAAGPDMVSSEKCQNTFWGLMHLWGGGWM